MKSFKKVLLKESILIVVVLGFFLYGTWDIHTPTGAIKRDGVFVYQMLSNDTYEVKAYEGVETSVEVPAQYDQKAVSSIGANAFNYNKSVEEIYVSEAIEYVGVDAFNGSRKLNKLIIPQGQSEAFQAIFSKVAMRGVKQDVLLYERGFQSILMNGEDVSNRVYNGKLAFKGKVQETLQIDVRMLYQPKLLFQRGYWSEIQKESYEKDLTLNWYKETKDGLQLIHEGSSMNIETLKLEDSGVYQVQYQDTILFRLQLDVVDDMYDPNGTIPTGLQTSTVILFLMAATSILCISLVIHKKVRSLRDEK